VARRPQPVQLALDKCNQLIDGLEVDGTAAHDMLRASAERIVRPQRLAGKLHDESVVRQEPAPARSVRFQLKPNGGIRGLMKLPGLELAIGQGAESQVFSNIFLRFL
jgi:hypothetical protein